MKKILSKVLSSLVVLSMFGMPMAPLVTYANAGYSISISSQQIGALSIELDGVAGGHPYVGQLDAQHVQVVDWGDGSSATEATFSITNEGGDGNDKFFDADWSSSHNYSAAGPYSITVAVCHSNCNGAEGADNTITVNVVIPPATLKVIKHVVNDGGGTATAGDFTMNVTGTEVSDSSFQGSENGTTVSLNAGSYSVDETTTTNNYTKTLGADCSGTLVSGDNKTCTVTNTYVVVPPTDVCPNIEGNQATVPEGMRIVDGQCVPIVVPPNQGAITVTKVVVNDNGGTMSAEDFILKVHGQTVISGATNYFNPGSYVIYEDTANTNGYARSVVCNDGGFITTDGSVTLDIGDNVACTITNNDMAPVLNLTKIISGGTALVSNWILTATGPSTISGPGGVSSGPTFQAGTYTLSESGTVANYTNGTQWNCDGANQGNSITLGIGGVAACTITNTYVPVPPTDICPNVTGIQTEGPCADSLCLSPNTWNVGTQHCDTPTPPNTCQVIENGPTHTINASAGPNGTITPSGAISVPENGNREFVFTPESGYKVENIYIDSQFPIRANSFNFTCVKSFHVIHVTFSPIEGERVYHPVTVLPWLGAQTVTVPAGTNYNYVLSWQGGPLDRNWEIFVHYVRADGYEFNLGGDFYPNLPTSQWSQNIATGYSLFFPANTQPGTYKVMVGLYEGFSRYTDLLAGSRDGINVQEDGQYRFHVGNVIITPPTNPTTGNFKVIVHTINDNGGVKLSPDFTVGIFPGNNPNPSSFPGNETGTDVSLGAGYYGINLSDHAGYTYSASDACAGLMNEGGSKTCTVTLDDIGGGNPPTDACSNIEGNQASVPEGMRINEGGQCVPITPPTDMCPNIEGNQSTVPSGKHLDNNGNCIDDDNGSVNRSSGGSGRAQCSDRKDNDKDGLIDANDPGCHSDGNANNPNSYVLSGREQGNGQVLGASTEVCNLGINTYMRKGYKNNTAEVKVLQEFLNGYMKSGLIVDGKYGTKVENAVKAFQLARKEKILTPWGLTLPTGVFYTTSLIEAKNITCPKNPLPIPTNLIPWYKNPNLTPATIN